MYNVRMLSKTVGKVTIGFMPDLLNSTRRRYDVNFTIISGKSGEIKTLNTYQVGVIIVMMMVMN